VIEKALSHEAEGIRAVYTVAEFAEQRTKMLQWWAGYVDGIANESKVIVGNFGGGAAQRTNFQAAAFPLRGNKRNE
jgi:hypothetical protein